MGVLRALALVLMLAVPAHADESDTPDARRAAAHALLAEHLHALARDDAATAYAHLAPNLQAIFPTPGEFLDIVRSRFAPVYQPKRFEFREGFETGDHMVVPVYLVGRHDGTALAIYGLQRQENGDWRITACNLAGAPPLDSPA